MISADDKYSLETESFFITFSHSIFISGLDFDASESASKLTKAVSASCIAFQANSSTIVFPLSCFAINKVERAAQFWQVLFCAARNLAWRTL